jgi:hypothetical protein
VAHQFLHNFDVFSVRLEKNRIGATERNQAANPPLLLSADPLPDRGGCRDRSDSRVWKHPSAVMELAGYPQDQLVRLVELPLQALHL